MGTRSSLVSGLGGDAALQFPRVSLPEGAPVANKDRAPKPAKKPAAHTLKEKRAAKKSKRAK